MSDEHGHERDDAQEPSLARSREDASVADVEGGADELPVVARMVVEIRSDGTRTVARGAVEDLIQDRQVAVEAKAGSPLELSRALAKMLLSAPFVAGTARLRDPIRDGEADADIPPEGLRERLGAAGRELGDRVARKLLARVLRDEK